MFNIGIYINNTVTADLIKIIIEFFRSKNLVVCPHIFTDDYISNYFDLAQLSSFYMSFYKNSILFTNLNDFLINRYDIVSNNVYVITTVEELKENYLTAQNLQNVKLLYLKNGTIYEI